MLWHKVFVGHTRQAWFQTFRIIIRFSLKFDDFTFRTIFTLRKTCKRRNDSRHIFFPPKNFHNGVGVLSWRWPTAELTSKKKKKKTHGAATALKWSTPTSVRSVPAVCPLVVYNRRVCVTCPVAQGIPQVCSLPRHEFTFTEWCQFQWLLLIHTP